MLRDIQSVEIGEMNSNLMDENKDDEMNKRTYQAVMDFSTKLGVPVALGLTVFLYKFGYGAGCFPGSVLWRGDDHRCVFYCENVFHSLAG